jgi:hypothetical protein
MMEALKHRQEKVADNPVYAFIIHLCSWFVVACNDHSRFYDVSMGHYTWFVLTCNDLSLPAVVSALTRTKPIVPGNVD